MHIFLFAALAATQAQAPPVIAAPDTQIIERETNLVPLPVEQQTALRCSVAMALAAERQRVGQAAERGWPDLTTRGREFFVRSLAQLMDDTGMNRERLMLYSRAEAASLSEAGALEAVMPGCLLLLDASGL
jgi:hypothetical protein